VRFTARVGFAPINPRPTPNRRYPMKTPETVAIKAFKGNPISRKVVETLEKRARDRGGYFDRILLRILRRLSEVERLKFNEYLMCVGKGVVSDDGVEDKPL